MNHVAGYARALPCGGWWAMLRFHQDAKPNPIMAEGGKPRIFEAEVDALREVNRHLVSYFNSPMFRDGAKVSMTVRAEAERLFRPGKKPVDVEVRKRGAYG